MKREIWFGRGRVRKGREEDGWGVKEGGGGLRGEEWNKT